MRLWWHRLLVKLGLRKKPTVWHGARAVVSIIGPDSKHKVIGIYKDITYGITYDVEPTYISLHKDEPPAADEVVEHGYARRSIPLNTHKRTE